MSNTSTTRRIFLVATIVCVLFLIYELVSGFLIARGTGLVTLTSSDNRALLTISQTEHQSINVGTGSARIRLKPGNYSAIATEGQKQVTKSFQVAKRQTKAIALTFETAPALPKGASGLFAKLPFYGPAAEYTVTAEPANNTADLPSIIITANTPQARQDALQWIRDQGYNPSDYNIQFEM